MERKAHAKALRRQEICRVTIDSFRQRDRSHFFMNEESGGSCPVRLKELGKRPKGE
jgi:hypothetical protein